MKRQAYQRPELRDANDNIIQAGTYGKESPLVNGDNTGVLDYINNNLEALRDNINGSRIYVKNKGALTTPGDISAMYIAEDTGKWYLWDGTKYIETDNARKIADEAIAARDAAKASANDAANSAREQQADWNVTDTTSKAFVKNKPINLVNIGNSPTFNLINFYKENNDGYPVYFLMHELVQYNPDKLTLPISAVYGFNGMVFSEPRIGTGRNQFLAIVKVGLGYEYNNLYSSSGHYSPVVLKDETNNKYYWAMKINGSYQRVYMLGTFSAPPLKTAILSVDIDGNLPEGWSLVHTARPYPFDNTHVANGVLPGTVTAFSGTFEGGYPVNKNTGLVNREWHLCDGTNGTPDLRNRFIYGGDGTNNGATGGETSHKLTEAELPALSGEAGLYIRYNNSQTASGILKQSYNTTSKFPSVASENCTSSVVKIAFGGNQPHNNMPPYFVLAFIMKL